MIIYTKFHPFEPCVKNSSSTIFFTILDTAQAKHFPFASSNHLPNNHIVQQLDEYAECDIIFIPSSLKELKTSQ